MSLIESDIGATQTLVYIPDYAERAVADMPVPQRLRTRMQCLLRAIGHTFQLVEDDAFNLLTSLPLDVAPSAVLDNYGKIVGEQRGAFDDATYRRFISARILANKCQGSPDELITIFQLITAPSAVEHRRLPTGIMLTAFRESAMDDTLRKRVHAMMEDARPMGIPIVLIEALPGYFGFEGRTPDLPGGGPSLGFGLGILAGVI